MVPYVFVIDDDPAILRLSTLILKTDGYSVSSFQTALPALAEIALPTTLKPDAIVLDLDMPEMSGSDFYRQVRLLGFNRPIIIVSALRADSIQQDLGAEAALRKPFAPDDLSRMLKSVIRTPFDGS